MGAVETPPRRVTIRDVAARAGVSTAAASLVLRKASGVSESMRERVEAAMEELSYRPLATARGMRGKTFSVGVMVSDIKNPFFGTLVEGMAATIADAGYAPLIGPGGATAVSQSRMIDALMDRQMDGLILIAPHTPAEHLERLGRQVPLVVVGRHGPAEFFDTVADDDILGSKLIVDHLVRLGHRDISYIGHASVDPSDDRRPEVMRERGYAEAMRANGLEDHMDIVQTEWSHEGGLRAAAQLMARRVRPTAIHGGADVSAIGVLAGLTDAGLGIPRDVSLVGYDNTTTASLPAISLTSVDQSGLSMGETAAARLVERIDGRTTPTHTVTAPHLIARSSAAQLA